VKVVAVIGGVLALASAVGGTVAILGLIDAKGWIELAIAPLIFGGLAVVVGWIAFYPGAAFFGGVEGLIEGGRLPPAEETAEALGALTIRDVRTRADALKGRPGYEVTSDVWRRLEQAMRAAGVWHVRELGSGRSRALEPQAAADWGRIAARGGATQIDRPSCQTARTGGPAHQGQADAADAAAAAGHLSGDRPKPRTGRGFPR
jgi:hypothetical protein